MDWLPIILFLLIGLGTMAACDSVSPRVPLPGLAALAFWTGAMTATLLLIAVAVATGRFYFWLVWVLAAACVVVLVWRRGILIERFRTIHIATDQNSLLMSASCLPPIGFSAWNIYHSAKYHFQFEIISFDAIGNFAMKAKLWFHTHQLIPEQLKNPDFIMFKRRYPPIVPLSEALWAYLGGGWDGVALKWFFLACWISVGLLIFALVRLRANALSGWLAAAVWFAIPINIEFVWIGALTGYADVPLALGFLAVSLMLGECREDRRWGAVVLLGLLLGAAFWTKKEGIPFALAALAYMAVNRRPWRHWAALAAMCLLFAGFHWLSVRGLPAYFEKDVSFNLPGFEIRYRLSQLNRLLHNEFGKEDRWGERLWGILILVWGFKLLKLEWNWRTLFPRELFFFLFMGAVYSMVCVFTIFHFQRNFEYLFERLMLQIYPLLLVATFSGFSPLSKGSAPVQAAGQPITPPTGPLVALSAAQQESKP
ncbi:MAG: hypothetical protein Kow0059_09000 [Candidatus Sumerlaeia bacterium]